jgi:hypothetical protein
VPDSGRVRCGRAEARLHRLSHDGHRNLVGGTLMAGRVFRLVIPLVAVLALGACRDEEQSRFKVYEPGVYQGQPDQALSPDQVRALSQRMAIQAGGSIGSGPVDKAHGDVRPPE